jgi:hypothetical protein
MEVLLVPQKFWDASMSAVVEPFLHFQDYSLSAGEGIVVYDGFA